MRLIRSFAAVLLAVGVSLGLPAMAQSLDSIKGNIERLTQGKVQVQAIKPSPVAGVYEVTSDGEIFYSDATGRYGFVGGALVDMKTQQDLTAPAQEKLTAVPFSTLPLRATEHCLKGQHKAMQGLIHRGFHRTPFSFSFSTCSEIDALISGSDAPFLIVNS